MSRYWTYPYNGLDDPRYIKDKNEFFAEHGNGWWWFRTNSDRAQYSPSETYANKKGGSLDSKGNRRGI